MPDIKNKILKIYEGLTERLKSPFILTFICVWLIQNWLLVYKLFNFDDSYTLQMKIAEINDYINSKSKCDLFWWPLFLSILSFLGYLFVTLIYESIYTLYTKWGRATVYYWIDRNKNVTRSEYEKKIAEHEKLDKAYKELETHFDNLKQELDEISQNLSDATREIQDHKLTIENLSDKLATNDGKAREYDRWVNTQNDFLYSPTRLALFHLFDFHYNGIKKPPEEVNITQIFFGVWSRAIYPKTKLDQLEHESYVYFDDNVINDHNQKYFAKVVALYKITDYEIYRIVYKDKENTEQVEILARLSDLVVVGVLLNHERNSYSKIVQYKKVPKN